MHGSTAGWQDWAIFSNWAIVNFGHFLEITVIAKYFWGTFPHGKSYVLFLRKNGLGYMLGYFFTNSSSHPDPQLSFGQTRWQGLINMLSLHRFLNIGTALIGPKQQSDWEHYFSYLLIVKLIIFFLIMYH
jgi:hypothetical protein